MKRDTRSYLSRVAIVLIVVSLVPALLSSAYNTNLFMKQTIRLVDAKNGTELARTGTLMERMLQQIIDFASTTAGDARFTNLQTTTEHWKAWLELNKLLFVSPFVTEYMLYNGAERSLLISNYGIERNPERSAIPWIASQTPQIPLYQYEIKAGYSKPGKQMASIVHKLPGLQKEPNYIIFNVDLDKMYMSFLSELNGNAQMYNYYLTDAKGTVMYHRDKTWIGTVLPEQTGNSNMQVDRIKLEAFDWALVREVNTQLLYKEARALKNKLLSALFTVIGVMSVFIVFGARELYKPFRSVVARMTESEEQQRRSLLGRFIRGETPVSPDLVRRWPEMSPYLVVAIITLKHPQEGKKTENTAASQIQHIQQRMAASSSFRLEPFKEPNGDEFILFQLEHEDMNRFMTELLLALEPAELDSVVISIGGIHSLEDIHKSYIEALYAYNIGRIYTADSPVYCFNKLPMDYEVPMKTAAIEELELAIRQQNERSFTEALNALFSGQLTVVEYNLNFYQTVTLLLRMFGQHSSTFLNELNQLITDRGIMNVTAVKQFLFAKFHSFRDYAEETKDYADRIHDYIVAHYTENFSLDEMAEHLGLSKQHLITVCKKRYNRTPIEYLNEFRIEEAKRLLADSRTKIADIGTRSGFNSNSYFAKVFKMYTGITASEYRELLFTRNMEKKPQLADS
ncbi:helix-turn-helix transcriptional regulator [Paenibacillus sp. HJGM_3]|uniref:helix-turn-helix transcriptional regulator n=1 Tax=Paenibacillus sp. HJGM_3 TaxID=3379816 RepID=UPI00385914FA